MSELEKEFEYDRNDVVNDSLKKMEPRQVSDLVLVGDGYGQIVLNYESFLYLINHINKLEKEIDELKAWKKRCCNDNNYYNDDASY